jgi:hypothetical protein
MKLRTSHHYVKGIHNYSNKGPGPVQRGDNYKNVNISWGHIKIFLSRTSMPENLKFT